MDLTSLTAAQHEERIKAAAAKNAMMRDGLSLHQAAAKHHVRSASMLRWFPGTIVREPSGDYRALPDHEPFGMIAIGHDGPISVMTRSSQDRSKLGLHAAAMKAALDPDHPDDRLLLAMKGTTVAGVELETDPDAILDLAIGGELDFLGIYLDGDHEE
jgi:hypothetical protein